MVFLAKDKRLGRMVALKVLTTWDQASETVIARFRREAAIASKLDHSGICTVYEIGVTPREAAREPTKAVFVP